MDEWTITNIAYYEDARETYGYKIEKGVESRIVSVKTAYTMLARGTLKDTFTPYLSLITVPRDYKENTEGLL